MTTPSAILAELVTSERKRQAARAFADELEFAWSAYEAAGPESHEEVARCLLESFASLCESKGDRDYYACAKHFGGTENMPCEDWGYGYRHCAESIREQLKGSA